MARWLVLVPLVGLASNIVAAGAEQSSGAWQATGPFKMSPASDRCLATATFKRGGQNLIVALESRLTGPNYEIRIYAPGTLRRWGDGKYSLGTVKLETDAVALRASAQAGTMIYVLSTNRTELNAAGPNPTLKIREILNPGELRLSGLGAAAALVDACSADLLERWGYSKEFQRELVTLPKLKKKWVNYVSPYDFPLPAISAIKGGETHALVDIGADGRASNCRIIRSSGRNDIDQTSCMVLTQRARFEPARNSKGEAIAVPDYMVFRWEIPRW
jgi:TonB family protein